MFLPILAATARYCDRRLVLLGALSVITLAACTRGDDVAAARWQTVTDTVGDTIVVRTVGASDSSGLLTLVEELRIGQFDGPDDYTFGSVYAVLPAPAGGVDVYDGTLGSLRRYDSAGIFVRRIGGKGGGPGEFDDPNGIATLPDGRLALWDARHQRMNIYDAAGEFATSWRQATNFFSSKGLMSDTAGTLYAYHMLEPFDQQHPGAERRQGLVRLTADGTVLDTLPVPSSTGATMLTATQRGSNGSISTSSFPVPYMPRPSWTLSPLGYLVTNNGAPYAVLLDRPGQPLRIVRDVPAVSVSADERRDLEEQLLARLRRMEPSWRWQGPSIPETKPPITNVRADAEGRIWVTRAMPSVPLEPEAEATPPGPNAVPPDRWRTPAAYDVYGPDGHFVGYLPLPRRTSLVYMHGDTVWATQRDSLDVPTVVRFRIEPSIATRPGGGAAP